MFMVVLEKWNTGEENTCIVHTINYISTGLVHVRDFNSELCVHTNCLYSINHRAEPTTTSTTSTTEMLMSDSGDRLNLFTMMVWLVSYYEFFVKKVCKAIIICTCYSKQQIQTGLFRV